MKMVIFYLPRFNNKLKLMTKAPKKVYVVVAILDITI